MVGLMIGSILSVALYAPPPAGTIEFEGQQFRVTSDGLYALNINGVERRFHNLPGPISSIPYNPLATTLLQNAQETIITFDPSVSEDQLTFFDAVRFELREAIPNTISAVTQQATNYPFPVVTCEQATNEQPIIELREGEPEVTAVDNCIFVSGNLTAIILSKDTLLYHYFDVLE